MKTCEIVRIVIFSILKTALFSRKESVLSKFLGSDFVILHNYIYSRSDHFGYHMVQDSLMPTYPIRKSQATHLKFGDSTETAAQKHVRSVQKKLRLEYLCN